MEKCQIPTSIDCLVAVALQIAINSYLCLNCTDKRKDNTMAERKRTNNTIPNRKRTKVPIEIY